MEKLVSKMTFNVLMGTLNPTHSLTQTDIHSHTFIVWVFLHLSRGLPD